MSKAKATTAGKNTPLVELVEKPAKVKVRPPVDGLDDGHEGGGILETFNQPLFEMELLTAGRTIIDSFTKGIFPDEVSLLKACRYIGYLQRIGRPDKIKLALIKINGTMAIQGRARNDAIQSHGGLYFPPNLSKDDKKWVSEMQRRPSRDNDRRDGEKPDNA